MTNFSTHPRPSNVINLATDEGLAPETGTGVIDGKPERMLNVDGVIALMRDGNTPEAREAYRGYRKQKARFKRQFPELEDAELRRRALTSLMTSATSGVPAT